MATTSSVRITNVVVLGSYYGYAALWLAAGLLQSGKRHLIGFDIDAQVCEAAVKNFEKAETGVSVDIVHQDAHKGLEELRDRTVDLMFIDVEIGGSKGAYASLLEIGLPKMRNGGVILAHDPIVPKFSRDFQEFHSCAMSLPRVTSLLTLPIDWCGLDILRIAEEELA